jgi:LysM repeat protein
MTAGRNDRRPVKIRRRGRHTTPSQVEKVAQQAGKAAPAVAIAGVLVGASQASPALAASASPVTATAQGHTAAATNTATNTAALTTVQGAHAAAATLDSFTTRAVTVAAAKPARHAAVVQNTRYVVHNGDTLSTIADKFYKDADDWQYLFHENDKTISDPNLIFVGQDLFIPATVPAHFTLTSYVPKHAAPTQAAPTQAAPAAAAPTQAQPARPTTTVTETRRSGGGAADVIQSAAQGTYSCSSLEQLWEQAGGNSADAFMAAEIAMAESSGNPNAISPTDDFGLWQINASNGSLATLNPLQNAKSAIDLSDNGANWDAWTTFTSGAYSGKC